jgi:bifunctional non-homologous end joining protein LigD
MFKPMLASLADAPLDDPEWVYEPKYDGIRAIAEVGGDVRLWSRMGNEKTRQFPEIAAALERWRTRLEAPVVLDGEIVALDDNGDPTGFQQLQGRIHLSGPSGASRPSSPVAFIVFDLLRDGRADLRDRPLVERRAALERLFARGRGSAKISERGALLRISEQVRGDGGALMKRAVASGWEGLIAKQANSLYRSGKRAPDWRKIKILQEQEFVVGGWTEPRQTRSYFGALLLGVYEPGQGRRRDLVYVGHSGTGFNERELARIMRLLKPLETAECPFRERPKTNEHPHWVSPEIVAQIRFTEWTADAKLRHPVFLGLRDDKKPTDVVREQTRRPPGSPSSVQTSGGTSKTSHEPAEMDVAARLIDQLRSLESDRRDGELELPGGERLKVTNLHKIFWPKLRLTKGDLFRYYARVAPAILPILADRPLVMKRFPGGVAAPPFYQHRAPQVPEGVRTEVVGVAESRPQIIGGSLKTLLYTTQLAAISQDPWFSRVPQPEFADHAALDLDPPDGVPFARVLDVARWIHDELEMLGAPSAPKTSGADGLHIYVPLPKETPYAAGLLFCQIIATVVAQKHPKVATVERRVAARGRRTYLDCLQNILGKTLASAYSARANEYAGVSTPLHWKEVEAGVDRRDFTIATVPDRLTREGDLWSSLRTSKGVDLSRVTRYMQRGGRERVERKLRLDE